MDCTYLCPCNEPARCDNVCSRNPVHFVARVREICGFEFDNLPLAPTVPNPSIPAVVPEILHGKSRIAPLVVNAAAVPLHRLFFARTGKPRFLSRRNLEAAFRVRPFILIVHGVALDKHLENYWSAARSAGFVHAVRALRPDLITVPNFSLFSDVPRWDNLYNMKRIAICWHELQSAGSAVALHVNGRTDRDYARWGEFLHAHPEIEWLAFEFATGAGIIERGHWHAAQLKSLCERAQHPLSIVVRGGRQHLASLQKAFRAVTFLSADPFMKTMKRQRLRIIGAKSRWTKTMTLLGQPLDDLLAENVAAFEGLSVGPVGKPERKVPLYQMSRSSHWAAVETASAVAPVC
jgi:hypothetical protein